MRTVRDVVMMVSGAALFVYSLVTASSSPLAYMLGMAMLCLPIVMHGDRRRERADAPAPVTRPDADVAQYLNDGDRAWLMEHGDWTDPATRIVERPSSASDTLAVDRKRRAEKVVSQMDSTDGWRTTRYADGRTVEHAVVDETAMTDIPQYVAVHVGAPPVASFSEVPTLAPVKFRTLQLWPTIDPDVASVQARPDMVIIEMRDGTRHEVKR